MKNMVKKEDIFRHFRSNRKPLSFRALAESLGLPKRYSRSLKRLLRDMVSNGEIIRTRKGLYGPAEEMSLATGYFEAHRDGYGFVILEKPGERDIFVPARATKGAMNNDRVVVRIDSRRRREGRIVRILERAVARVAGRVEVDRGAMFLRPKKKTVPFDIHIPPKFRGKAKHGDMAVVEIMDYPTDMRPPSGRVVKIMGRPDDPRAEIEAIIDELGLPRRFPREVTEAARRIGEEDPSAGQGRRKDLTRLKTVTIDGETAKDFDDAVSVKCIPEGYRLYVHIADVGHYVKWNDAIDMVARERGTSVYFPDRVLPMLPRVLSEDLCSLKPRVRRLAFTVEMDFDRDGNRIRERFYPSVIRSDHRMTYTSVKKIIVEQDRDERRKYESFLGDFELMAELAGILRTRRMERGSLDFDLPEPEIVLDLQGNLEAIIKAERNFAHMLIEEFMIAANEAVAGFIENRGVPSLYRVHEEPDEMKLNDVLAVLRGMTHMRRKKIAAPDIPMLLKGLKGHPAEDVFSYIVLRSLKQARYSTENIGHFGLASDSYTHFTSPIRRYPDLVVHRILRELVSSRKGMSEKRVKFYESVLPDIAFHSSRRERLADEAEREVIDAMRAWFMKDFVGDEFDGTITGIVPRGIRIRLKEYFIEGFLHVSEMTDDFYVYNEHDLTLRGRNTRKTFRIGDMLRVRVDRVDLQDREIIFSLV